MYIRHSRLKTHPWMEFSNKFFSLYRFRFSEIHLRHALTQWRRQDLLRGGAKMEICHGALTVDFERLGAAAA